MADPSIHDTDSLQEELKSKSLAELLSEYTVLMNRIVGLLRIKRSDLPTHVGKNAVVLYYKAHGADSDEVSRFERLADQISMYDEHIKKLAPHLLVRNSVQDDSALH